MRAQSRAFAARFPTAFVERLVEMRRSRVRQGDLLDKSGVRDADVERAFSAFTVSYRQSISARFSTSPWTAVTWITLRGDFRIDPVIDGPMRSYLLGNSLVDEDEPWPHGDRAHGAAGILEHLGELIGTTDPFVAGRFLIDILKGKVRGRWMCPCGGCIIRKCHREAVDALRSAPPSMLLHAVDIIHKDLKRRLEQDTA
jgi:hypothetical protein